MGKDKHVHAYSTRASFADDHDHGLCRMTGEPVYLPSGSHCHEVRGKTTCDEGHRHTYSVYTGPAVRVTPRQHAHCFQGATDEGGADRPHLHGFQSQTGGAVCPK